MLGQPWKGYYLTAYGIAVKHGFTGTEEEWLRSLRGKAGAAAEFRYNESEKVLEWRPEGSEEWKAIVPLSEMQGEVVSATLGEAEAAKESAEEAKAQAKVSAQAAAESETKAMAAQRKILQHIEDYGNVVSGAYVRDDVLYIQTSSGKTFAAGNVRGGKGDTGDPGVYIGAEEPKDENVRVWINPSDHETLDELMGILNKLQYTDGGVEVDLSDYLKTGEAADKLGLADYVKEENANDHTHDAADITEGALPIANGGHGGSTEKEALDNLGLSYVPAVEEPDEYGDLIMRATIPGITELVPGVVARIIPSNWAAINALNVNGLGARHIRRYGSDSTYERHPVIEICGGRPMELVYDGECWICTQLTKPLHTDIEGFMQMRADVDYLAELVEVEL